MIFAFKKEKVSQTEEILYLRDLVERLVIKIAELSSENAELRARLSQHSGNSSRPPSVDGYRKKSCTEILKAGVEKKKRGGQIGHKGNTLHQISHSDFVVEHKPAVCNCGHHFGGVSEYEFLEKRQVFEIPPQRIDVYEHHVYQVRCPVCGQKHKAEFPSGVTAQAQYGNRMRSFIAILNVVCSVPMAKISQIIEDLFGVSINEGTIVSICKQLSGNLEASDKILQQLISNSDVVNADETGIRISKKTSWLHNYSTPFYTYLFPHVKRGTEAIEKGGAFLKDFKGWLIHDCWKPYFKLTNTQHGLCNAHLIRELQFIVENNNRVWAKRMQDFLVKLNKTPFEERLENQTQLKIEYDNICRFAKNEEPPPIQNPTIRKGRKKKTKAINLLERLIEYKEYVLAFAFNKNVPFTNNLAERDLRTAKIKMKVSNCFRSFEGAEHYARIASFISTARKNKHNIFEEIYHSFCGFNFLTVDT
ncbi:MAG: IS66 family transposase [Tannerella sp.]|nr:IS66 family transposase [Tannerella sp.]